MSNYVRGPKGRFQGSIGSGARNIPNIEPIPSPDYLDENPAWGEQADLQALLQGWQQFRESKGVPSPAESTRPITKIEGASLGLYESVGDEEARSFISLSDPVFVSTDEQRVPSAQSALAEWEALQAPLRDAAQELEEIEYFLAKKMDAENVYALEHDPSGATFHPVGGPRYTGWRHEDIQTALIAAISREEVEHGTSQQQVAAIVSEYASYSTPTYYRVSELERLDIDPSEHADVGQDDRRLVINGLPNDGAGRSVVVKGAQGFSHRDSIRASLSHVSAACRNIRTMDTAEALVTYAAVRNRFSHIRESVDGMKELARRQVEMTGEAEVLLPSGTAYQLVPGRRTRVLDMSRVRPQVVEAMSRDLRLPRETVERVVAQYEAAARVTSYRSKVLQRKVSLDIEEYSRTVQAPSRLVSQVVEDRGEG